MRIAISGPVGSGKTTLATALSERLSLPVIPEDMTQIVGFTSRIAQARTHNAPPQVIGAMHKDWMKAHVDWVKRRKTQANLHNAFISDRWEADILSFWLVMFGQFYPDKDTKFILDQMVEAATHLTVLIRLPPAPFFFGKVNDAGLMRRSQLTIQLLYDSLRDGLLRHCPTLRIIDLPASLTTIEGRCDFVVAQLAKGPSAA